GFFVPAGVPHRPGTALTLEIQEPSDVYTMLERESGGRTLTSREMHPGFTSVDRALALVDFKTSTDPALLRRCYLRPEPVPGRPRGGGRKEGLFPPRFGKFGGSRLVREARFESVEGGASVALVWRGRGRVNGIRVSAGSEFLVTARVAIGPHLYEAEGGQLEVFLVFPPAPEHFRRTPS